MGKENKRQLTLGSLFDGSGGFPLGGILAGIHLAHDSPSDMGGDST